MDFNFLSKTILFRGIAPQDIQALMGCLNATAKKYKKDELIFCSGESTSFMGIVLSGSVSIENDDIWGNRSILDLIGPGQIFAESYACIPGEPLMINAVANENTEILFLNTQSMFSVCANTCAFHNKLIQNMLVISAQKSLNLSRRILHTSSKTIRGRLLSYLSYQATCHGSKSFEIPFSRQQLADYLNVDRSAMSNELSKMQRDGIIKLSHRRVEVITV